MGTTEKIIAGIQEGLDKSVSGAIHQSINQLEQPIQELKTIVGTSSKKTGTLTKWLIFWTAIMALAVIGQIVVVILTNSD